MARISTYTNDASLQAKDRLIGTDGQGGIDTTNNYTLEDLKEFVNLGVDVAKRTPRLNIPVVDTNSKEVYSSSLIKVLTASPDTIKFVETNIDPAPVNTTIQHQKADINFINPQGEAYVEFENYDSKFDIYSFAGKNFSAVIGADEIAVTGQFTTLMEVEDGEGNDRYYRLRENADGTTTVIYRYGITRGGTILTSWAIVDEYTAEASDLTISRVNNLKDGTPSTLDLVEIHSDSNFNIGTTIISGDLTVEGEVDFTTIPFEENGEGIIYKDKDKTQPGSVSLLLRTNSAAEGGNYTAAPIAGYHNSGSMPVLSQTSETIGEAVLKSFLNIETPIFDYDKMIFSTTNSQTQDGGDSSNRSLQRVEIDHSGINTYYTDGSNAGEVLPVTANDITDYRRPAPAGGSTGPDLEGVLTQLQIGDKYYTVPTSVSQVAQTLPGLSERLTGVPNGSTTVFEQATIGRTNNTTILADDTVTGTVFDEDEGYFAFYDVASGETLTINSSNALVYSGTGDLAPETDAVDLPNMTQFVIANNHLRGIAAGDVVTIFNNVSGSTNLLTFTVDTALRGTISGAATKNAGEDFWLITFDDLAFTGGSFDLSTDAATYQMSVTRAGSAGTTNTHTFFYGDDHGTFVTWEAAISGTAPTNRALTNDPDTTTISFDQDTNLNRINNPANIPTGNKLFFTTAAIPSEVVASAGNVVPGNVYEVVSYVHDNGEDDGATPPVTQATLTYSLVGQGSVVINPRTLRIPNLPTITTDNPQFLVIDPNDTQDRVRLTEIQEVAGLASVVNWDDTESTQDGVVGTITFDGGSENHNVVASGTTISVDITGRNSWASFPTTGDGQTTSFTANIWHEYLLSAITSTQTITLPDSTNLEPGERITIHNLADIATDGSPRAYTTHWEIATPGTERIMKDTGNLVLNEANTFDLQWSGNAAIGWVVK